MNSEFAIAVHALVCLSRADAPLSSEQLAGNICTNPARVRKVVARLRRAGLVATKEGAEGGCRFTKNAERVTLLEVLDALETRVVCATWRSGSADLPCLISAGMAGVMDELYGSLDEACRKELSRVTVADLGQKICANA